MSTLQPPAIQGTSTPARSGQVSGSPADPGRYRALLSRVLDSRSAWLWVVAFGVGVPFLMAAITGNLAFPHNDAWSYSRITSTFWRTGQLHLLGWDDMMLIGQVLMVGPLGRWIFAQQTAVAVLAAVCVWCVYDLVSIKMPRRRALFAALVFVLWPGFASLSTSFMTDVPALAGTLLTLCVGRRALARESRLLFVVALLIGFWAGSVGIQTLAATVALGVYTALTFPRRTKIRLPMVIATAIPFAIAYLLLMHWRNGLPNGDDSAFGFQFSAFVAAVKTNYPQMYFTLAAGLAPAAVVAARPWRWRWLSWLLVLIAAAAAVRLLASQNVFYVGNYFWNAGEYYMVEIVGRESIPTPLWHTFVPVAVIGGVALAGSIGERWRRIDPLLGIYSLFTLVGLLAVPAEPHLFFDRYLMTLLPGALAIALAPSEPRPQGMLSRMRALARLRSLEPHARRAILALGVLTLMAVGSMSALDFTNQLAYDAARWHTASLVVAHGVPADRVDAGLEWIGTHSGNGIHTLPRWQSTNPLWGWESGLYNQASCVLVMGGSLGTTSSLHHIHWSLLRTFAYHTWLFFGTSELYVYDTHAHGCASAASV